MKQNWPFTKEEADKLVKEPKFIKVIPRPIDRGNIHEIWIPVYRTAEKNCAVPAFFATARQRKGIPGAPKPLPSAPWCGKVLGCAA